MLALLRAQLAIKEQIERSDDARQRRTQLVADRRDEHRLRVRGLNRHVASLSAALGLLGELARLLAYEAQCSAATRPEAEHEQGEHDARPRPTQEHSERVRVDEQRGGDGRSVSGERRRRVDLNSRRRVVHERRARLVDERRVGGPQTQHDHHARVAAHRVPEQNRRRNRDIHPADEGASPRRRGCRDVAAAEDGFRDPEELDVSEQRRALLELSGVVAREEARVPAKIGPLVRERDPPGDVQATKAVHRLRGAEEDGTDHRQAIRRQLGVRGRHEGGEVVPAHQLHVLDHGDLGEARRRLQGCGPSLELRLSGVRSLDEERVGAEDEVVLALNRDPQRPGDVVRLAAEGKLLARDVVIRRDRRADERSPDPQARDEQGNGSPRSPAARPSRATGKPTALAPAGR